MRCFALVASLFVASSSLLSTHAAPYQQHAQQQQQQVAFSTSKIDNDIRIIQYADDVDALAVIDERTLIALLDDPRALAANAAAMGIISPPLLAHFQRHADAAYGPGFIDVTAHYPDDLPSREDIRRVRARSHAAMHRIIGGAMSTVRAGTTTADQGHHSAVAVDLPRLLTLIDPARLNATIAHLSTDFRTRHYKSRTAETVPAWIAAEVKAMIKAYGREEDVRVRLVAGKGTPRQSNVIVEMARDDASGNNIDDDELVVIGAHEDSISSRTNYEQAAPGADDDAT